MFRGVAVPFALFLVVVVVVCSVPSLAATPVPHCLTHQELSRSIIINRLAILKGMNESTSFFASHGNELSHLREDMEKAWQAMNETREEVKDMNHTLVTGISALTETMKNEIQRLNETGEKRTREINNTNNKIDVMNNNVERRMKELADELNNEIDVVNDNVQRWMYETGESRTRAMNEMNAKIQSMDRNIQSEVREFGEQMETEINYKIYALKRTLHTALAEMNDNQRVMENLVALQNAVAVHHQRPDLADLFARHNDTFDSLCDGHKVLFGSRGVFEVARYASENYTNNVDCSWDVTLPEGSRPVFRWYTFDIERCSPCSKCDYVYVHDPNHPREDYCGDIPPDGSYLTVMNNKFRVGFHSDHSNTGRGFMVKYRAVERN